MKYLLFVLLLGTTDSIHAQKVSKEDSTYINIDNDDLENYIQWPEHVKQRSISFDTISNPRQYEQTIPISIQSEQYKLSWLKGLSLFLLDTSKNKFYGNPLIFKELNKASGVFGSDVTMVATMVKDYWPKSKKESKELAYVLMRYSIIELYSHLYAEVITTASKKKSDGLHISYKCLWHYCTNDCYDPIYEFEIVFSEKEHKIFFDVK